MGIRVTDIMYELKRLSVEYDLNPNDMLAPKISKIFVDLVEKNGRIPDGKLASKFVFLKGLGSMVGMIPLALKLKKQGRLTFSIEKVRHMEELEKMWEKVSAKGGVEVV